MDLTAGSALFGRQLGGEQEEGGRWGELVQAQPPRMCPGEVASGRVELRGRVAVVLRGGCSFEEKAREAQVRSLHWERG